MVIEKNILGFDKNIERAHEQINNQITEYDEVDRKIISILNEFNEKFKLIDINVTNNLEKELKNTLEGYKIKCKEWGKAIQEFIKGKEFVNQFEKSVLVVVFGDVNVGKSSVGNIMAGVLDAQRCEQQDISMMESFFGKPPEFFEYDLAGSKGTEGVRKSQYNYFKEGAVETTANIQYFTRKQGLTWTDSPGIHSVNKSNEELAKKYVEYADLVIFVTTSSSPAKRDEVKELERLFSKSKPVLIVINKSDKFESDEVDGEIVKKLVPKSEHDRKLQEDFISDLFIKEKDNMFSKVEAISISTYLAVEGLRKKDDGVFESSGIPKFYEKLGNVLSEKAVALKMRAPKDRINSAIMEIIEGGSVAGNKVYGICQFIEEINTTIAKINDSKSQLEKEISNSYPELINEVYSKVDSIIFDAAREIRTGSSVSMDVTKEINDNVESITKKVLEPKIKKVINDCNIDSTLSFAGVSSGKVEAHIDITEREEYDVKTVNRDPNGFFEWVESKLFDVQHTREKVVRRTITEQYKNGDNSNNILAEVHKEIDATIKGFVKDYMQIIFEDYFKCEEVVLGQMKTQFELLEKKLNEVKMQ